MLRSLKVAGISCHVWLQCMISKGNHVKFASFVLLAIIEEAKTFFFCSMYNKIIIRFGFSDIQKNQGLGKGYQPQPSALAENPHRDLDYSGYHKNLIQWLFIISYLLCILSHCTHYSLPFDKHSQWPTMPMPFWPFYKFIPRKLKETYIS